ncbi:hypothetical protein DVH24_021165 [Malus domestica]|uniref:Uncharacterized protein n=1 Tax=Malus domestica TaxID=3750 RepID=A0A498JEI0_MALDO|nr:hypothetical protein DVH24_021165 [Malus domestica]
MEQTCHRAADGLRDLGAICSEQPSCLEPLLDSAVHHASVPDGALGLSRNDMWFVISGEVIESCKVDRDGLVVERRWRLNRCCSLRVRVMLMVPIGKKVGLNLRMDLRLVGDCESLWKSYVRLVHQEMVSNRMSGEMIRRLWKLRKRKGGEIPSEPAEWRLAVVPIKKRRTSPARMLNAFRIMLIHALKYFLRKVWRGLGRFHMPDLLSSCAQQNDQIVIKLLTVSGRKVYRDSGKKQ